MATADERLRATADSAYASCRRLPITSRILRDEDSFVHHPSPELRGTSPLLRDQLRRGRRDPVPGPRWHREARLHHVLGRLYAAGGRAHHDTCRRRRAPAAATGGAGACRDRADPARRGEPPLGTGRCRQALGAAAKRDCRRRGAQGRDRPPRRRAGDQTLGLDQEGRADLW